MHSFAFINASHVQTLRNWHVSPPAPEQWWCIARTTPPKLACFPPYPGTMMVIDGAFRQRNPPWRSPKIHHCFGGEGVTLLYLVSKWTKNDASNPIFAQKHTILCDFWSFTLRISIALIRHVMSTTAAPKRAAPILAQLICDFKQSTRFAVSRFVF